MELALYAQGPSGQFMVKAVLRLTSMGVTKHKNGLFQQNPFKSAGKGSLAQQNLVLCNEASLTKQKSDRKCPLGGQFR